MDLLELLYQQAHPSWHSVINNAANELKHTQTHIDKKLLNGQTIYPKKEHIFKAFSLSLDDVKVVIMGQDPYHDSIGDIPRANGLAFSSKCGKRPPSLNNIIKEIKDEYREKELVFETDDLQYWLNQGVLLLNSCLTVRPNQAGSHGGIWLGFITKIIQEICRIKPNCIFVLWGKDAQAFMSDITTIEDPLISSHPSPFSANRGFFGNKHFIRINERLKKLGLSEIDWSIRKVE